MARLEFMSLADTRRHWEALLESRKMLRTYCREVKISRANLIISVQRHFPDEWADSEFRLGPIEKRICEYCSREFYVNTGRQRFCDDLCTHNARVSRDPEAYAKRLADLKANYVTKRAAKLASQDGKENPAG